MEQPCPIPAPRLAPAPLLLLMTQYAQSQYRVSSLVWWPQEFGSQNKIKTYFIYNSSLKINLETLKNLPLKRFFLTLVIFPNPKNEKPLHGFEET